VGQTGEKLEKLCTGVRAIAPGIEIRLKPSEGEVGKWSVIVSAGDAILVYTDYEPLDGALTTALAKLASISQRMLAAVRPPDSGPEEPGEK
jgi:hypothetical protein